MKHHQIHRPDSEKTAVVCRGIMVTTPHRAAKTFGTVLFRGKECHFPAAANLWNKMVHSFESAFVPLFIFSLKPSGKNSPACVSMRESGIKETIQCP